MRIIEETVSAGFLFFPSLSRNLIVDSSYQGHRSSSLPPPPGPWFRSALPCLPTFGCEGDTRGEKRRKSVLSCFAHSDDNAGDTEGGRGGECAALLKGLRRFTLRRRYDWITSAVRRERRMSTCISITAHPRYKVRASIVPFANGYLVKVRRDEVFPLLRSIFSQ